MEFQSGKVSRFWETDFCSHRIIRNNNKEEALEITTHELSVKYPTSQEHVWPSPERWTEPSFRASQELNINLEYYVTIYTSITSSTTLNNKSYCLLITKDFFCSSILWTLIIYKRNSMIKKTMRILPDAR